MDVIVLEPLKGSAARLPDELFDVVFRVMGRRRPARAARTSPPITSVYWPTR